MDIRVADAALQHLDIAFEGRGLFSFELEQPVAAEGMAGGIADGFDHTEGSVAISRRS